MRSTVLVLLAVGLALVLWYVAHLAPPPREPAPQPTAPPPATATPLVGVVRDEVTGLPLADLTVVVDSGEVVSRVTTGADGTFTTGDERHAEGDVTLRVLQDGEEVARAVHPHAPVAPHAELRVPIGPTVLLAGPAAPWTHAPWELRLVQAPAGTWDEARVQVSTDGLALVGTTTVDHAATIERRVWPWIPLHAAGEPAYARYPRSVFQTRDDLETRVELRSPDGAVAWARDVPPLQEGRTTVRAVREPWPDAWIEGHVVVGQSPPPLRVFRRDARVVLVPRGGDPDLPPCFDEVRVGQAGAFTFEHVPPGRYDLVAYATHCGEATRAVQIVPGRNVVADLVLPPRDDRPLARSLPPPVPEVLAGKDHLTLSLVSLASAEGYARSWVERLRGDSGAPRYGELPDTTLLQRTVALDDPPRWLPEAEFRGRDLMDGNVPEARAADVSLVHRLRVVDGTGTPLRDAHVRFGPAGALAFGQDLDGERVWTVPAGAQVRWTVGAPRHAPVTLTEEDFVEVDGERRCEARLAPGWGASFVFRAGDPLAFSADPGPWAERYCFPAAAQGIGPFAAPAVRDATVLLNGVPVARADADGVATVALPWMPWELSLVAPGWRVVALTPMLGRAEDRWAGTEATLVWLTRE